MTYTSDEPILVASPAPGATPTEASLLVAFTRMEAKVDVALARQGADLTALAAVKDDHETRLRAVESRAYVSPRTLWTVVCSGAALVLAVVSIFDKFSYAPTH